MAAQVQSLAADGEPHDPEETICIVDGCGGAYSFDPIDSSVARYINRDLARDALHVLEAIETLGSPANEETIHHVKVVCADGEIRAALDAIALLLPRLRSAAALGESATPAAGALARVLASPEGEAIVDPADCGRLLELVAAARGAPAPLNLGAALASMPVLEYACEGDDGPRWFQRQPGRFRAWRGGRWRHWSECGDPIPAFSTIPCRPVPLAEADADPATRGPL